MDQNKWPNYFDGRIIIFGLTGFALLGWKLRFTDHLWNWSEAGALQEHSGRLSSLWE